MDATQHIFSKNQNTIIKAIVSYKSKLSYMRALLIMFFIFSMNFISLGQKTWDGGAGTNNWSDGNNWDPNGVPLLTDDVIISRNGALTINVNGVYSCNSLAVNYTGNTNGTISIVIPATQSLSVTNDITFSNNGNGGENASINVSGGTLNATSVTMNNTPGNNRDCYIQISNVNAIINISGDILMNGTNLRNYFIFTANGILNVGGNMSGGGITSAVGGGTNPTSGTVNYNGAGDQNIGTYTYYNLTASTSGTKTLLGATTVTNLSIQGSAILASDVYNITGNAAGTFTMDAGTELTLGNTGSATAVNFPSNFTNANITLNNTSTVTYQTDGAQNISGTPAYGNLTIATSGTKTMLAALTINNNLSITGSATLYTNTYQITGNATGILSMASGTGLNLGNAGNATNVLFPSNYTAGNIILDVASTVTYQSNGAQTVSNVPTYGNLTIATNGTTKTCDGALTIDGNLSVNGTSTFSMGTTAATWNLNGNATIDGTLNFGTVTTKTINLAGDLINTTGTINMTGAGLAHNLNLAGASNAISTFTTTASSGSTVNYTSAAAQQVFNSTNYQNMTISGGGTKTLVGATTVNNILNLTSGILQLGNNNLSITNNATDAIQGATFDATNMIEINGTGYLIRPETTAPSIFFPIGSAGFYSPLSISSITPTTTGTISARTERITTLGSNYLERFWDVITSLTGRTITATFQYNAPEVAIPPTQIYVKPNGAWETPSGTQSFGVNDFTITGTTNITNTSSLWTAGPIPGTFFSYQTGDWDQSTTWTSDPGGTTHVDIGIPDDGDVVVILANRTVTLTSDIDTADLEININEGGVLDMGTFAFTNASGLAELNGQGRLRLASDNFPTAITNTFVDAGGGTTEYYNASDFTFPITQLAYNHLQINAPGVIATQMNNITVNGDLHVKQGTYRINDNNPARRQLTINGDVTVDAGASLIIGTGATNSTTDPTAVAEGGTAPFIDYYDTQSHRVVINGNFTNNGTVRFTNQSFPVFNAFPSDGFATVYFQGATNNTLTCNNTTDFYNLVLDKGVDQSYSLTVYSSAYRYFRLFGANNAGGYNGGANPNLQKALWIRTGTLVLKGLTVIPSLSEGTCDSGTGGPNSDFFIPANGALKLDGSEVIVLSTADDYGEVDVAYNLLGAGGTGLVNGVGTGGCSSFSVYGKFQVNYGYFSARESGGLITWNVASGQFVIRGGTVDAKQFRSAGGGGGLASFDQSGGTFILRGRFQHLLDYSSIGALKSTSINTTRATEGSLGTTYGTFNLNEAANVFTMSGGTIRIYDVCGDGSVAAQQKVFEVLSSSGNINVTGGTLMLIPNTGDVPAEDSPIHYIISNASLGNLTINRASGTSTIQLSTYPLNVLSNLTLTSGELITNNLDVSVGGNFSIASGTTYTPGTNWTMFNGSGSQTFTVNLAAALSLKKFKLDKPAGTVLTLTGSQMTINIEDSLMIILGTLADGGKTINLQPSTTTTTSYLYNSGRHTGAGKIALTDDDPQIITGDGNGIFQNLEINNTDALTNPVSLGANITINGTLTLSQDKLFDISTYNLKMGASAIISGASSTRFIQSAGNAGDGGITKTYSATSTSFVFPVGAPSTNHATAEYSPATIAFGTNPSVFGTITVIPVGYEHPNTTTKGRSLTYFWRVKSSGFTLGPATLTHTYLYSSNDVVEGGDVLETGYVAESYDNTTYTWTNYSADTDVDETTNTIGGTGTNLAGVNYIDGEFTAGDDDAIDPFDITTKFYSLADGDWNVASTWSNDSHTGAAASTTPGINDIVIVGNGNTVTLTQDENCASLQIEEGSTLDIYTYTGSVFSIVLSHPNGNGLFRVTTPVTPDNSTPGFFTFPDGDFTDFNVHSGTTEFYDIDGTVGALYILPANVTQYGNLILTARGGDNLVLPNNAYTTIYGDLTCTGNATTAWIAMSWNTNIWPYYTADYDPTIEKTVHVMGDMYVNAGSFEFFNDEVPQHLIVDGNLTIAPGAVLEHYGDYPFATPVVTNTLEIGGSLINNNRVTLSRTTGGRTYNVNTKFSGTNSASITNESGTPTTVFSNVTIDKGSSQDSTLTIDIGGTLTTPANNWLTLQNGTLRYMRTDPSTDFTISTTSSFTIPSTAGLYINYPNNASNRNILIANSNVNTNDLYLNGKLTIINGNVYVGPTNGTTVNNNDIEYSGGGDSEIEMQGGSLIVNGQVRRNVSTTNGVLTYIQSGGDLVINGQAAVLGNAKFEIPNNPGNVFNMSGGTITIVRGGGTTYGDLYLRAVSSTVTGGEIIFTQSPSIGPVVDAVQNYTLEANVALNDLTIKGKTAGTARNATVTLFSSPLIMNGDLTIDNVNSIFDANTNLDIDVTVKGGFTNNGLYNHYENLTTFSGGAQTIAGNTATDFYDLDVNPVTSLTLIRDITVFNDLSILSGQLLYSTYNINVEGDFINNANYDGDASQGGVILNGSALQNIYGSGTFGRLELDNMYGAKTNNDITLQKNLKLTEGILDINEYLFSLGENSIIEGSSFGTSKMITTNGVYSDYGLLKYFGIDLNPLDTTFFTYPIGTSGKYTPAALTFTENANIGYIRINNINNNHPGVLDNNNVLDYYWDVESDGIEDFQGSLVLSYLEEDVEVTGGAGYEETDYIAAALLDPGTSWQKSAPGPLTDNVDETLNTITFDFPALDNITGEYTCGIDAALPDNVPQFRSIKDGVWNDPTVWEQINVIDPYVLTSGPNGFIVTISPDDSVSIDANYAFTYRMTINGTLRVVYPYMGNNFGRVLGNGTLYLESATFPAGRFDDFFDCLNTATLEYGGTRSFTLIADLYSSIPKLHFTGTGVRALPNKDLTICQQLLIDGPTLDNSVNNKKLTIQGTMERYNTGEFISGSGAGAIVSFAGSAPQIIGDTLGNFTGDNAFNHFEINNSDGLTINENGAIEVTGNLLLTDGNITTSSTDSLIISNTAINCIFPSGGSATSFVNGPLIKQINQGDEFNFPIGKGTELGNKLTIKETQTGTLFWTAEYFTPNSTYISFTSPLTYVNSHEYWTISAPSTSEAIIDIDWEPSSDLTPLMTQNGLTDMRVANYNTGTTSWEEISTSSATGDNNNGTVSTTDKIVIPVSDSINFTTACINVTKPRARLNPSGAVCGAEGIPLSFTGVNASNLNFEIEYKKGGSDQVPITITSLPYTLSTDATGTTYQLTGFKYNSGATTGVVDPAIVTSYTVPDNADAGSDQSNCGATSTTLDGNEPLVGSGLWDVISGTGGTVVNPTIYNSVFNGTNGTTYELTWTITNGGCSSTDTVIIAFPLNPVKPVSFTVSSANVCKGQQDVIYTVANDPTVTYTWGYSGSNYTITQIPPGNSVSIDFASNATSGTLSVYTTNGCGDSAPLTLGVTVNPLPQIFNVTGGGAYCTGGAGVAVGLSGSVTGVDYILYRDGISTGNIVSGIDAVITFGLQTIVGTYTVVAQNTTTLCTENMNGSKTVTINPLPNATISVNPLYDTLCTGNNTEITIDFTAGTGPFDITISDGIDSQVISGITDDPYTFSPATIPLWLDDGTPDTDYFYTITILTDANSCSTTNIGNEKVTIFKAPETGPQYHLENY